MKCSICKGNHEDIYIHCNICKALIDSSLAIDGYGVRCGCAKIVYTVWKISAMKEGYKLVIK